MKNTKQNTDQENSDSLLNERGDVTCSEGEAVTELLPSSGSIFEFLDRGLFKPNGVWTTDRYGRCGISLLEVILWVFLIFFSGLFGFLIGNKIV